MWFPTAGRVPRILHACAVAAGLVTFTAGAQAQSAADKYPDKPIKIIVPFAPGGSADILSRVVGNKLTESFGQTIVVETRPGAGTVIGTAAAAKAEPDGYTLLDDRQQSRHQSDAGSEPALRRDARLRADLDPRPRAGDDLRQSEIPRRPASRS